MRVTTSMMCSNAILNADTAATTYQNDEQIAETGLQVQAARDNPGAAALIVLDQGQASQFTAIGQAAGQAVTELQSASSALSTVSNVVSQARELAVQMSNSTYSASDLANAASQVQSLLATAVSALNTNVAGRYIFGGDKDSTPPFDAAGNYSGDDNVRQVEIAPGVYQAASINADTAINGAGGGVNVLSALSDLATALTNDDTTGISTALGELTQGTTQVNNAIADAGTDVSTLSAAVTANQQGTTAATTAASNLSDADQIAAASNLSQAQAALSNTLDAISEGFQMTLVDKLSSS